MTKDEAKTVCVQPAQDLRSFPEAADGRPMPPMGDELMTAGLNCEDALFVAIQLAQNGLTLAPAAQDGAEVEALRAERDALKADNERLRLERQALAEAICGGEDFPGLLEAQPVEALVDTARKASQSHGETIDALLRAEAERDALKAEVERLRADRETADQALVDRYRDPKSGRFDFPGDVAKIVRALDAKSAEVERKDAEIAHLMRLIRLAHPVMRECGWQFAPACAAEGSDGILEAACAEIEEEFGDMLRTDEVEAGQ